MLKCEFEILKFIYKNPKISKKNVVKKFPKFEDSISSILPYLYVEDKCSECNAKTEEILMAKAQGLQIPIGNIKNYVESNMQEMSSSDECIFYTTTREFQEFYEKKRREFWFFILPYGITTFIAISSVAIQIYNIFH